jgi:glycosyltransferase involved in cell wall biosynthesis
MKIMHVASGDLWGGAEAMLLELARAQVALGERVHVALFNDGLLAQRLATDLVPVQIFPESTIGNAGLLNHLKERCRSLQPDVVHTHRIKENVLGALAARSSGVPVCVRTAHGDTEHRLRWFQILKQAAPLADRLVAFHLQHTTVAVSNELACKLQRRWMQGRVEVVPNGLDPERIRRTAAESSPTLPAEPESIRVCIVCRLVPVKRVDLFLAACSLLAKNTRRRVHAYILGDGPLRAEIESLTGDVPDVDVTLTGFVSNPAAWMRQMDLMAITSDHEGLPVCLLEALAIGTPVVSRSVGGIPDVLTNPRMGRLVATDRADEFASAMAVELQSRDTATEGVAGELFPSGLTADAMARGYHAVYVSAAARRQKRIGSR